MPCQDPGSASRAVLEEPIELPSDPFVLPFDPHFAYRKPVGFTHSSARLRITQMHVAASHVPPACATVPSAPFSTALSELLQLTSKLTRWTVEELKAAFITPARMVEVESLIVPFCEELFDVRMKGFSNLERLFICCSDTPELGVLVELLPGAFIECIDLNWFS